MLKKFAFIIFGLCLSFMVGAEEYRSAFGYSINLPSSWIVLSPQTVKKAYKSENLSSLGLESVDRETALEILEKVKSGQVEFYFDKAFSTPAFKNNISVQIADGEIIHNTKELKVTCDAVPEELSRIFKTKIALKQCALKSFGSTKYSVVEYSGSLPGLTTIQNEFALDKNKKLVVVGGSNDAGLAHLRVAQSALVKSIAISLAKP